MGHVVMENRHGLVVRAQATWPRGRRNGTRPKTWSSRSAGERRVTVGRGQRLRYRRTSSKRCATWTSPRTLRRTPAAGAVRSIGRTTRHPGYAISQRIRKRVEEVFGWLKTIGLMRKLHHRGTDRVDWMFVFACAIYNLVRIRNLQQALA